MSSQNLTCTFSNTALGVANNNLGTMVLQEQMERSSATAKSDEVYFAGMKYFEEAIRIGTFEYQNADFDDSRGDYVKQVCCFDCTRGWLLQILVSIFSLFLNSWLLSLPTVTLTEECSTSSTEVSIYSQTRWRFLTN